MGNSEWWQFSLPDVDIVPETAYQNSIYQLSESLLYICVYICQKCHNLYSVIGQDAIFCCLKVLQLKFCLSIWHFIEVFFLNFMLNTFKKLFM